MKIFIPSWRRPTSMTTPRLLRESGFTDYKVIVRDCEYQAYVDGGTPRRNLLVVGDNDGLNVARERARKTLKKGEWCLQMDDNVQGFVRPELNFYWNNEEVPLEPGEKMITRAKWQSKMSVNVDFKDFYENIVQDTLAMAEAHGAHLCGFSAHENPAFRPRKYTHVGYVCGKVMLMHNVGLCWNQSTESAGEDYALTAAHLWAHGRVLVNKWGHPRRVHYQPGGCGPYEERLPAMLRAQKELTERYGSLFGIKNAKDPSRRQGELRLAVRTLASVEQWRGLMRLQNREPNL